ncbi:MAG: MBL fold metallo-hydrolase, partial [Roseburia sp.]|nr:MBL fold metallo-hydrolase [Roseburia sp.]
KNAIYMLNNSNTREVFPGQMNSFIVETETGELIVIDGGYRGEWEHLLNRLKEISGKSKPRVTGWFLSHAHHDHIECFMEMIENHSESIEIENVYYNFPSKQFIERHDELFVDTIREFYGLLPRFADIAVIVSEGDCYEIGGAVFEILYSPNPAWTNNAVNNSSIVIRLTLGGKKILLLGDLGEEAGKQLLDKYGDGLKSDYCQMAHHGQAGMSKSVYQATAPGFCMWCTPCWLWDNDAGEGYNTSVFKTIEVRKWMEEIGVKKHYVMKDGDQTIELCEEKMG